MAANPTAKNQTTGNPARKLTLYDLVIGILAIFSLIILIPIYFGSLPASSLAALDTLENLLCIIFLIDFFRSLRLAPDKWAYFLRGGGWLDLLGSIPFVSAFAIFRVARLFRVVRLMRNVTGGQLRNIILNRLAQSTLLFTLVVALILVFTLSWGVFSVEHTAPHANIVTYEDAVWWGFVTITTVGYGDFYPVTGPGRFMAVILMFFGLGIIGVLSSFLASTFVSLETRRRERRARRARSGEEVGEDEDNGEDEENGENGEDETINLEAELAAMKEELTAIKQLLEQHYQAQ
jgi:voltage-gated potassium channel